MQREAKWKHIARKQQSLQQLKRKLNDAEAAAKDAGKNAEKLADERNHAVARFVHFGVIADCVMRQI